MLLVARPLTVAEGWEQYARQYKQQRGKNLGDEWNDPKRMGLDMPPETIVAYLDEKLFTPFLGNPDVLLEIGPGGGRFTEILLPKCRQLIAADTAPEMLNLLEKRFPDHTNIRYLELDGHGLAGVKAHSVDAAFSYGVFVHLQHWDIYNYLVELKRVLKPGGKALIQHANTFSDLGWDTFVKEVRPSLNKHKLPGTFSLMTPEIIREFTRRAGLQLEACITDLVPRDCISLIRVPG